MIKAQDFCDADDGSVHDLLRFVPGYEPEERPPYEEEAFEQLDTYQDTEDFDYTVPHRRQS
jgi:hypothetical protein